MSMTAPGCGMGDVLRADALRAVEAVPGVDEVEVSLVWYPPWTIERMSEAARLQLGIVVIVRAMNTTRAETASQPSASNDSCRHRGGRACHCSSPAGSRSSPVA